MKKIEGDLLKLAFKGEFDVIVHGCNCFHQMGAGIAKPISQRFPEALAADKETPRGERDKLGTISIADIQRGEVKFTIVNAYTQFQIHGPAPRVDYDAVKKCFMTIGDQYKGMRIGYPLVGAGLAGGDWTIISKLIDSALAGSDHTLVVLPDCPDARRAGLV